MEEFNKQLDDLKRNYTNPFTVPDGYFDTFPTKIQERIFSGKREKNAFTRFITFVKPQLALGLMIAGFAFIAITIVEHTISNQTALPVATGVHTRIVEVDASEFSEQHFIDVLLDDNKKPVQEKKKNAEHYINYLVDEDIDYGTLIDEL